MTLLRLLHTLALFWMMAGLGAVVVPVWRAWAKDDLQAKALLLTEASENETRWLLPGILATAATGFAWAGGADVNVVTTGWLLVKLVLFAVDVFIFLPLLGVGLRRVRYLALQAQKRGEMTEELRDALADNVPVVFATVLAVSIPVLAVLAVYKPW